MKFRKKPIVVDAMQFTGDVNAVITWRQQWEMPAFGFALTFTESTILIPTLEGVMIVKRGDWIVRGIQGEFYSCKSVIFEAIYEPVAL